MRKAFAGCLAAALLLACGCAAQRPGGVRQFYDGDYASAKAIYLSDLEAEKESRALFLARLGTLELAEGNVQEARRYFEEATGIMENFKAEGEYKALVGSESSKEYKGDPYEQMMALWYLGLLDYMSGDFNKALPSFKAAALADGGTTDERYRADCAAVFLMMGKAYQAMGDDAKAADEFKAAAGVYTFQETVARISDALASARQELPPAARESKAAEVAYELLADEISAGTTQFQDPEAALAAARDFAFDELAKGKKSRWHGGELTGKDADAVAGHVKELYEAAARRLEGQMAAGDVGPLAAIVSNFADPSKNFLAIVGMGKGPFKYRVGEYGQLAKIGRSAYPEKYAEICVDGQKVARADTIDSIYYQASTRGGRVMDGILAGKAVFKGATEIGGAVALAEAANPHLSRKERRGAFIVGAALLAASLATRPEADVRSWETLPDRIDVLAAKVAPGTHRVEVNYTGGGHKVFENVEFKEGHQTVLYAWSQDGGAWACPEVSPR